jgi:rhodanese-related sulfurtransferase
MLNLFRKKNPSPKEINIDKLIYEIELGEILLIDTRNKSLYEKSHIKTAINIPDLEFESNTDKLPIDKLYPIVFYCKNPECTISINSAKKAIKLGYKNVYIFKEGIDGWNKYHNIKSEIQSQKNALDEKIFKEFYKLNKSNILLVDVSDKEDYHEGHLKNAISFPFGKLPGNYLKLSREKNIIFYCRTSNKAHEAYLFLIEKKEFDKNKIYYLNTPVKFENGKVKFG